MHSHTRPSAYLISLKSLLQTMRGWNLLLLHDMSQHPSLKTGKLSRSVGRSQQSCTIHTVSCTHPLLYSVGLAYDEPETPNTVMNCIMDAACCLARSMEGNLRKDLYDRLNLEVQDQLKERGRGGDPRSGKSSQR